MVRSAWFEKGKRWLAGCRFGRARPPRRPNTSETGMKGELVAYAFLKRQGYRIVAHRYRSRSGEIDLIGWDGDILAFIEVKYRRNRLYGGPEEAVDFAKQRQICRVQPPTIAGAFAARRRPGASILSAFKGIGRIPRSSSSRMPSGSPIGGRSRGLAALRALGLSHPLRQPLRVFNLLAGIGVFVR